MEQNVKKRNAHNICYGKDQVTGKSRHISEVVSGLKCGCACFACGEPLEARKGSVRKHHFAHTSNYECMYASEVAIYRAVADILDDLRYFHLPPITLSFPAWNHKDQLKEARKVNIEDVSFSCEPFQYPPLLFVTVSGKKLRILLEFENYYSQDDIHILEKEAREGEYSSLLCHFPSVDDETFFMPEHLKSVVVSGVKEEKWIRSTLRDQWQKRYLSKAIRPAEWGTGYECFIHVAKYRGKYSARWVDCAYCSFNLAEPPGCLCLAVSGVQCHEDFSEEPSVLRKRVDELRQKNDQEIERQEKQERQEKEQRKQRYLKRMHRATFDAHNRQHAIPYDDFSQPQSATFSMYSCRMIQCSHCGQTKSSNEFAAYGGSGSSTENICKICARKMT